ncbi:MAG: DUF2949 domain-containing protein, partial [Cyanobacteriota bacterium]
TTRQPPPPSEPLGFLRQQLGLREVALARGQRQSALEQAPLPAVLWRYGLITLDQLDQVLSWQDNQL